MNTRALTLALVLSGLAMMMVYTYIDDTKNEIVKKYGAKVAVVIAKKNIAALELIDDSKVILTTVPKTFAQPQVFTTIKDIENTIASVPIIKGEQITKPRVDYPGVKTGLAQQISAGKRAFAIQISPRQAVSKLIQPGDRVDVIAAISIDNGRKDMQRIETVLQDKLVLSTGKQISNSLPIWGVKVPNAIRKMNAAVYEKYNTVTLELTPFEVQKILHVISFSGMPFYLSLRNNGDKKQVRIAPTTIYDTLGDPEDISKAKQYFNTKYNKR